MSSTQTTTNFKDNYGSDLGTILMTKDYLMSVYPGIAQELGITPELWVWGTNTSVELGRNNTTSMSIPTTTFAGGSNWKQVSAGLSHGAAIKSDGSLWGWGIDNSGRHGNGAITTRSTPVTTFAGGNNWKQVSCGANHNAAIKTDGTLWTWGGGTVGQLGNNLTADRSTPVTTFAGGNDWKQVSCGNFYTAAVKTDGSLWVWGQGASGKLGTGDTSTRQTPVTVSSTGKTWKLVSCGVSHTAAVKTDGTLWLWGLNSSGQLGLNDIATRPQPTQVFGGGNNWKQVSCGNSNTAAIKTDGTLWTWGNRSAGALGNNSVSPDRLTPVTTFAGGTNWKQVSCGNIFSLAIKTDGSLWGWGFNSFGQLGTNDALNRITPTEILSGQKNWLSVLCGDAGAYSTRSNRGVRTI